MEKINPQPVPERGTPMTPAAAMALAISEAYKGAAGVSPNPLVGSVVLDSQGRFLQAGYHEIFGGPHAEVRALHGLTEDDLKDAHVIVTLEPCAHEGKTPSCARMLAKLPLKKVSFGLVDPNPLVAGKGAEIIRAAGIEAEVFPSDKEMQLQLEEVCEAFLWNYRQKKVFVSLKMASSIDGQVALKSGESQWITGPESREFVHMLRASYDAVLVGKGTVEFDNPSLNIRHPSINKHNKVVVLDSEGELLKRYSDLNLVQNHNAENIFWCVSEELRNEISDLASSIPKAPQLCFVRTGVGGELDLSHLLTQLWDQGIRSVMVEGGAMTASSFVNDGLVNRIFIFQAPIIMGSGGSRSWTESVRIAQMSEKIILNHPRYMTLGNDFMLTGTL
jgi:diaminohydroxyphosphoribosylaminopyrimidine deaminase/5-amino-6-(5-phosphoribosylamino)uracil reductase